jgi:hypothetical protein
LQAGIDGSAIQPKPTAFPKSAHMSRLPCHSLAANRPTIAGARVGARRTPADQANGYASLLMAACTIVIKLKTLALRKRIPPAAGALA